MGSPSKPRGSFTCQRRGRGGWSCGGRLEFRILPGGQVVTHCLWCERYDAGRCFVCNQPVFKQWARRCGPCHRLAKRDWKRTWKRNHPEWDRAQRQTPEARRKKLERTRRWRENNPLKVALSVRRIRLDPVRRARQAERLREWRRNNPDKVAAMNARRRGRWARLRQTNPERYRQLLERNLHYKRQKP